MAKRLAIAAAAAAAAALVAAAAATVAPAGATASGTISACINSSHQFTHVTTGAPLPCPSQTPVSWPGNVPGSPSPSPSPTSVSPSPSATASPSPTATAAAGLCPGPAPSSPPDNTADLGQNCGPYSYKQSDPMSNGFDTYVSNQNVGSNAGTTATATVTGPGHWSLAADAVPYGYGGVQIFANIQQLTNDWNGSGWGGSGSQDTPLASLSALTITYAETTPRTPDVSAEFAPDIWQDNYPSDIMFWADTQGRCNNGAYGNTVLGAANFGGQTWTVNRYGGPGAEIIFVLDTDPNTPNSCAQQASGTIDVKAGLDWLTAHGILTSPVVLSQVNAGWEITSADHGTFAVSSYSINAS